MGFMDIFRKKKSVDPQLREKLAQMKCKAVNYETVGLAELCAAMESGDEALTKLVPVNYYAVKNEYIEASFYSDSEHEENYVIFRLMKNDRPMSSSGIYPVSKDTLRKVYMKLGAVDF